MTIQTIEMSRNILRVAVMNKIKQKRQNPRKKSGKKLGILEKIQKRKTQVVWT
jgi:hypothetical protein